MRVAINGMGIAGPTLAYWLRRSGHDPVFFEKAPAVRSGGYRSADRVALVGDAAACPSLLAGEGTGLGMLDAGKRRASVQPPPTKCFSLTPREPFYGCDGCRAITHMVLVKQAGARVCGVVFQ